MLNEHENSVTNFLITVMSNVFLFKALKINRALTSALFTYSTHVKLTNQPVSFLVVLQERPREGKMWNDWILSRGVWPGGV